MPVVDESFLHVKEERCSWFEAASGETSVYRFRNAVHMMSARVTRVKVGSLNSFMRILSDSMKSLRRRYSSYLYSLSSIYKRLMGLYWPDAEQDIQLAVKILRLTQGYVKNLMKNSGAAIMATIWYTSFSTGIDTSFLMVKTDNNLVQIARDVATLINSAATLLWFISTFTNLQHEWSKTLAILEEILLEYQNNEGLSRKVAFWDRNLKLLKNMPINFSYQFWFRLDNSLIAVCDLYIHDKGCFYHESGPNSRAIVVTLANFDVTQKWAGSNGKYQILTEYRDEVAAAAVQLHPVNETSDGLLLLYRSTPSPIVFPISDILFLYQRLTMH
ncbi:hypothetical protein EVAR_31405_1 [Eumeta japonica]|uniref:Uncharacterized protein n=1 Tax=Eumeta variegata TaxID=151549 RepID=A0A4C1UYG5_EUMVA|nr:hypothetical protein EVAR_31405_1 [Eumeta japonica]